MGAGQSTASQVPPRALHVLRVTPSSPASQTTIEPYFDFVVGYKGDSLDTYNTIDASELERIVESHEGLTINLLVWNSKSQETRTVPITPSRDWSSPHANLPDPQEPEATERKPSLLGLSMRICQPEFAMDNVWHVLDVLEGSPAESAGLVPYGDWIIGWSGGVLSAEGDFYDVVEAHIDKPLRVYVYSYDFDTIREVVVIPNRHWGGEGLLGCVFGFGLLHRIPPLPADREPGTIPPELAAEDEEDDYEEHQLFVPADLPGAAETPEELEERMQWEQEEWERVQSYGHNYVHDHDPAYQTSSAYPGRAGVLRHGDGHGHGQEHHLVRARGQGYDAESSGSASASEVDVETPHPPRSYQQVHVHHHEHGHAHSHDHHGHDHDHDHDHDGHDHGHDHDHSHDHNHAGHNHSHHHDQHHENAHGHPPHPPSVHAPVAQPHPHPQTPLAPVPRTPQPARSMANAAAAPSARSSTPTQARPFGGVAYMNVNGLNLGRSMSPRAPSWMGGVGVHSPSRPSPDSPVRRGSWARAAVEATTSRGHDNDEDGDDREGDDGDGDDATTEMTDTTDATSTSQGSLTSVD